MVVGAINSPSSPLTVANGAEIIQTVDKFQYGGILFSSASPRRLFAKHYKTKASQAKSAVHSVFATQVFVGSLSVPDRVRLCYARVYPYLMYGSEVVVDVAKKDIDAMEGIQTSYLRRLNGVGPRVASGPLRALAGVMDLESRWVILALDQGQYTLNQHNNHFAKQAIAMQGSIANYREFGGRKKTWIGDIATVLSRLKHPVLSSV